MARRAARALDRSQKLPSYAEQGVANAWLIDPWLQTLEVFRLAGSAWRLLNTRRGAVAVRAEPFETVDSSQAKLWARQVASGAASWSCHRRMTPFGCPP